VIGLDSDDDGGSPIGGVTLMLLDENGVVLASTTTGHDGSYLFGTRSGGIGAALETNSLTLMDVTGGAGGSSGGSNVGDAPFNFGQDRGRSGLP